MHAYIYKYVLRRSQAILAIYKALQARFTPQPNCDLRLFFLLRIATHCSSMDLALANAGNAAAFAVPPSLYGLGLGMGLGLPQPNPSAFAADSLRQQALFASLVTDPPLVNHLHANNNPKEMAEYYAKYVQLAMNWFSVFRNAEMTSGNPMLSSCADAALLMPRAADLLPAKTIDLRGTSLVTGASLQQAPHHTAHQKPPYRYLS